LIERLLIEELRCLIERLLIVGKLLLIELREVEEVRLGLGYAAARVFKRKNRAITLHNITQFLLPTAPDIGDVGQAHCRPDSEEASRVRTDW